LIIAEYGLYFIAKFQPAVDIKDGLGVRLVQGRKEDETVFSDNPAAMALKWAQAGAELIRNVSIVGRNRTNWL
jgi:phosphoribosylformimino-5-aminoimidazole carboxamide ribonucleotide (ProFAR) isomerase